MNRVGVMFSWLALAAVLPGTAARALAEDATTLSTRLRAVRSELEQLPTLISSAQNQQRLGFHGLGADPAWVMIDFGRTVTPEKVVIFPARLTVPSGVPSAGFPSSFQIEISDSEDFSHSIRIALWQESPPGAGEQVPFLSFDGNRAAGRFLRVRVTGFRDDHGQAYFRLGEIVVLEHGRNAALTRPVKCTLGVVDARAWEPRNLTDGYFWCLPLRGRETSPSNGHQSAVSKQALVKGQTWVEVDLGSVRAIEEVHLVPAHPGGRGYPDVPGFGFPTHFQVVAEPGTPREQVIRDENRPPYPAAALPNPGAAQVMFHTEGLVARCIRISCEALGSRGTVGSGDHLLALSEIQCWSGGKNVAAGCPVRASDAVTGWGWSPEALTDGYSSRHALLGWSEWLEGITRSEALQVEAKHIVDTLRHLSEVSQKNQLSAAVGTSVGIAVVALAVVFLQRAKARKQQDALRARIARDLHDEIGASLSHLAMQGDLARQQLQRAELTPERLENISASARETLDQMRDIIWLLAPVESGWPALAHRMEAIARRLLDGVNYQIIRNGNIPVGRPSIAFTRDILAFLKEGITNVRKHAAATHVRVGFEWGSRLVLTIEDDGSGFDTRAAQNRGGSGLENLQNRAAALKATCRIQSTVGKGTRIQLDIPLC